MRALLREATAGIESLASGAYGQGLGSAAMRKMTHWVNRSNPVVMNNVARISMGLGAAVSARASYVDARRGEYGKAALWGALGGAAAYGAVNAQNTQANIRSAISLGRKTFFKNAAGTVRSGAEAASENIHQTMQFAANKTMQIPRNQTMQFSGNLQRTIGISPPSLNLGRTMEISNSAGSMPNIAGSIARKSYGARPISSVGKSSLGSRVRGWFDNNTLLSASGRRSAVSYLRSGLSSHY